MSLFQLPNVSFMAVRAWTLRHARAVGGTASIATLNAVPMGTLCLLSHQL